MQLPDALSQSVPDLRPIAYSDWLAFVCSQIFIYRVTCTTKVVKDLCQGRQTVAQMLNDTAVNGKVVICYL